MSNSKSPGKIVACYTRVSTGYQADRDSLPYQRKELSNYCQYMLHVDPEQIVIFEDAGKSGKNTDRPAFQRMMKKVRAGQVSHVVVFKIDRISRNLIDFAQMFQIFKDNGVAFISLREQFDTSSAMGEAMLKIILVFAELERQTTAERVLGVMIGRAQEGKWNGARMPFGWMWDEEQKRPVHNPDEAPSARLLYEKYLELGTTPRLLDYCIENNIKTKRGGRWNSSTLTNFLRNPMNKGDYRYNYKKSARGTLKDAADVVYLPGVFEPLVSPLVWDKVNNQLTRNAAKRSTSTPKKVKSQSAFAGLLVCGSCGKNFIVSRTHEIRAGTQFRPSYYTCGTKQTYHQCNERLASDIVIGPVVMQLISNIAGTLSLVYQRRSTLTAEGLERRLLSGAGMDGVISIDPEGIEILLAMLKQSTPKKRKNDITFIPRFTTNLENRILTSDDSRDSEHINNIVNERGPDPAETEAEEARIVRALERLKKAYLFDDFGLSESEYLDTRRDLENQLAVIRSHTAADPDPEPAAHDDDDSFTKAVTSFLLANNLLAGGDVDYPKLQVTCGDDAIHDFLTKVIRSISVKDRYPETITFRSGLILKLAISEECKKVRFIKKPYSV